mmetsp:Transcript_25508/g.50784  ORF Transcript_25508/g.50784 Transcript_25508/m.50784 type:complete len:109 (-) Transcript_25508:360-686(-)
MKIAFVRLGPGQLVTRIVEEEGEDLVEWRQNKILGATRLIPDARGDEIAAAHAAVELQDAAGALSTGADEGDFPLNSPVGVSAMQVVRDLIVELNAAAMAADVAFFSF